MAATSTTPATAPVMQRLAVPEDMDAIARLLCMNPDDGTLWQWPSLVDDWHWLYCGMIQWLSTCFLDETMMIRVAVLPAENGANADQIVGMSIWLKRTAQQDGTIVAEPWGAKPSSEQAIHDILAAATAAFKASHPDIPSSVPAIASHSAAIERSRNHMPPSPRLSTPSMHLNAMAVSKSHQRRGIGRALVAWGKTHGLPIYVTGEEGGLGLYRACGFHVIRDTQVWLNSDGEDVDEADGSAWERDQGGCSMGECVWVPPLQESSSLPSPGREGGRGLIEIRGVAYSASE